MPSTRAVLSQKSVLSFHSFHLNPGHNEKPFLQHWEIMKALFETCGLEEKLLLITREKKDFSSTVDSSMLQFLISLTKCSHKPLNSGNSNNPSKMVCYQQLVTSFLANGLRGKALKKLCALFPLRQFNWLH